MTESDYIIEDNVDFYSELHKSITAAAPTDSNKCLISDCELTDYFVQLECGHKFNYVPLFRDAINHRDKFNLMETARSRVGLNEIRCPYCRHIHRNVLPYYKELGLAKIKGINVYIPKNTSMCQFNMSNMDVCYRLIDYNDPHTKLPAKYEDRLSYCYRHKCFMTNYYANLTPVMACNAVLKSGSRKGQVCGCGAMPNADKCGKHMVK